jgi:hypothetical protein
MGGSSPSSGESTPWPSLAEPRFCTGRSRRRPPQFINVNNSRVRARTVGPSNRPTTRRPRREGDLPTLARRSSKPPFWSGSRLVFHPSRGRCRRQPLHRGRIDAARQSLWAVVGRLKGEEGARRGTGRARDPVSPRSCAVSVRASEVDRRSPRGISFEDQDVRTDGRKT